MRCSGNSISRIPGKPFLPSTTRSWSGVVCLGWRSGADRSSFAPSRLRAFAGSGLLHAFADFLTHHDDARRQFWPVSDWVFQSPVSYWDGRFYGDIFAPLEFGLVIALAAFLLWRLEKWRDRLAVLAIAAFVVAPALWTGSLHGLHGMG